MTNAILQKLNTKKDQSNHPAILEMREFNKAHPHSKEIYKQAIAKYLDLAKRQKTSDGVFLGCSDVGALNPFLVAWYSATALKTPFIEPQAKYHELSDYQKRILKETWGMHLFCTWRLTQSIYKMGREFLMLASNKPIPDETPLSFFATLPEWSQYIELENSNVILYSDPNSEENRARLIGFWATYDLKHLNGKYKRILLLTPHMDGMTDTAQDLFQPYQIPLDPENTLGKLTSATHADPEYRANRNIIRYLLSCLLWLCTDKPDINKDGEFVAKNELKAPKYGVKKSGEFLAPNAPTVYTVGQRAEKDEQEKQAQLKRAKDEQEKDGNRSHVRPHIRKAHWHGFWKGKVSEPENRKWVMHWIPSIFVNGK